MSHKKLRLEVDKMNDNKQIFFASRWTAGNLLFPVSIEVSKERVAMHALFALSLKSFNNKPRLNFH